MGGPVIPWPTPVVGAELISSEIPLRLPIDVLQNDPNNKDVFNLYIIALNLWQTSGNETIDPDNVNGTGYLQICGIHGVPFVNWQDDPTGPAYPGVPAGYCTHASTLFLPWHRPYIALYEQILYAYAKYYVDNMEFKDKLYDRYTQALQNLRLPYWDWASDSHLPSITMQKTIDITVQGDNPDTTEIKQIPNPLYSYAFTSKMAMDLITSELQSPFQNKWSLRCPDVNGVTHDEIADSQNASVSHRAGIFSLMSIDDFGEFSNTAWSPGHNYDSLESHHNTIHNFTGGDQSQVPEPSNPVTALPVSGNMEDLWSSSFDPIFWLHHVNVDRLWAIWQAIHPGSTIDAELALFDRWTKAKYVDTKDTGDSHLEPFHKNKKHDMSSYWLASDMKEIDSAFNFSYQYPETPFRLLPNRKALASFANARVWALYGPVTEDRSFLGKPISGAPKVDEPAKYRTEWQAFIRAKRFAVPGSWSIHVFLGEPPKDPAKWISAENRVDSVNIFAPRNIASCANCQGQNERGMDVTGAVYLTDALIKVLHHLPEDKEVSEYLKANLYWTVAKMGMSFDPARVAGLKVGVSATPVTYPDADNNLSSWGERRIYPEITEGKPGGFGREDTF